MIFRFLLLPAFLLTVFTGAVGAAERMVHKGVWTFSADGGLIEYGDMGKADLFSVRLGYGPGSRFLDDIHLEAVLNRSSMEKEYEDTHLSQIRLEALCPLFAIETLQPFFALGAGGLHLDAEENDWDISVSFGGGLTYPLTHFLNLRTDVRNIISSPNIEDNWEITAGLTYAFGTEKETQMPLPDKDGDGILDYFDHCPKTQPGVVVNGRGCAEPLKISQAKKLEPKAAPAKTTMTIPPQAVRGEVSTARREEKAVPETGTPDTHSPDVAGSGDASAPPSGNGLELAEEARPLPIAMDTQLLTSTTPEVAPAPMSPVGRLEVPVEEVNGQPLSLPSEKLELPQTALAALPANAVGASMAPGPLPAAEQQNATLARLENVGDQDNDSDGVPDHIDECPNTPSGMKVNEEGCVGAAAPLRGKTHVEESAAPEADPTAAVMAGIAPVLPASVVRPEVAFEVDGQNNLPPASEELPQENRNVSVATNAGAPGRNSSPVVRETMPLKGQRYRKFRFNFAHDQWQLTPAAESAIARVAKELGSETKQLHMKIEGHTDAVGADSYNLRLSQRRAASVAAALVNKAGFDPNLLFLRGYGESSPIADNNTAKGRAANRRVDILILLPQEVGE